MEKASHRAILVGVEQTTTKDRKPNEPGWGIGQSIDELRELCWTAGIESVGELTQKRGTADSKLYLGEGKLDEAKALANEKGADLLVFDDELTPAQIRNIERETELAILDRTQVILDIFAQRASSREGKLQVELAQLTYLLPRLRSSGENLSRLGGGIGTRGPGETKLETDTRKIRDRISDLHAKLDDVEEHRNLLRKGKAKNRIPLGAIVGYTNAGKSTLLRTLTTADVLAENMLFATLDPVVRGLELPSGRSVMLSDTVGFIRKLPHTLVAAFKSTLEEVVNADFLVHVVDASNPFYEGQIKAVDDVLNELGAADKPTVMVMNKCDMVDAGTPLTSLHATDKSVCQVSLKEGTGIDGLLTAIEEVAYRDSAEVEFLFPFDDIGSVQLLRQSGNIIEEEYCDQGLRIKGVVDSTTADILARFRVH